MRHPAAGIVVLAMLAAGLPVYAQRAVVRGSRPVRLNLQEVAKWQAILRIEDARDPTAADISLLVAVARRADPPPDPKASLNLHHHAVRALGRFERLELVPTLRGFLQHSEIRGTAELALLTTLRAHASTTSPHHLVVETVNDLIAMPASPVVLGNLPINFPDQFAAAEDRLRAVLNDPKGPREAAARGLEALARRNRRIGRLRDETVELLKKGATWRLPEMQPTVDEPIVFHSMAAVLSAAMMDEELVGASFRELNPEIRRLGALALYGSGSTLDADRRTELIAQALKDRAASVRLEGLRAWARWNARGEGCGPIVDALSDARDVIVLAAIDALAESCPEDEAITARLASEVRTPPNGGRWHRETHALVALAKRAPDRAASGMPSFSRHLTWQVRMYAARAAAVLKDIETLSLLAYDADDNVRHAALPPLRLLTREDSDAAYIAALGRGDYQLLRTIAMTLSGAPHSPHLLTALTQALDRVTAEKKDTSRDTRLALMERIAEQGGREAASIFERLLTDSDPRIATAAAAAFTTLTGRAAQPAPRLRPRPPPPSAQELEELVVDRLVARVDLDSGGAFDIALDPQYATLTSTRFLRLVRAHYFDGLTFHRVAPNFVVQGGSPRANEYAGDDQFMPDELRDGRHATGTVGLSTRGRDTGDGQFFINLVENRTLEFEYTVFGLVTNPRSGADLENILEGTQIRRIRMVPPMR